MRGGERGERVMELRRRVLLGFWVLAFTGVVGRAVQVQVMAHDEWASVAASQHRTSASVAAPRGPIVDRSGAPLAVSQERWEVALAPREIDDAAATAAVLAEALETSEREMLEYVTSERPWVVLSSRGTPRVRETLRGVPGVHLTRELRRVYPRGDLAMGLLGRVLDGNGRGGVEEAFDQVLRGRPGTTISPQDSHGRDIPGQTFVVEAPQEGGAVELTLDMDLQEIGQEALQRAIERTGARGGDLVISDPENGDILAMVSLRDGRNAGLSGLNTPYEPGSTLKPFTVSAMLEYGVADLEEQVSIGNGIWRVAGRVLQDVHPKDSVLSLADALRVSSNVGVAKLAQGLTPEQQYTSLRDFGFGSPTALGIPGEASGTLRPPKRWSRQSPASLAIGYEINVTPLQLVSAYGALANGGLLMEPRLIRRVRSADGRTIEEREPRAVRRVVSTQTAQQVTDVLEAVVEDGTGTALRMESFAVAGKSGTSRIASPRGGYLQGEYYSSFVGYFPADDPQFVILVKLENPQGTYYGGATAAPVTRETLEAILAARRSPLDLRAVARQARVDIPSQEEGLRLRFASLSSGVRPPVSAPPVQFVDAPDVGDESLVPVPALDGVPIRDAVRRLHALGFRVERSGTGAVQGTSPAAGSRIAQGATVRLNLTPPGTGRGRE